MSVRQYRFEEIKRLYADIRAVISGLLIEVREQDLAMVLRSAYIANRAALACTYGEEVKIMPMEEPQGINPCASMKQVFKDIGLLLYNCVSNGGRDFMPRKDRDVLEGIRLAIAWHLVEHTKEVST